MKICQFLASHGDGGLEKHVRELSSELSVQNQEVTVLANKAFLDTLPNHINKIIFPTHLSRRNPFALLKLYQVLKSHDFDIIHAQANKATAMLSFVRPVLKKPTIATVHNIKNNLRPFYKVDHVITVSKQLANPFPKSKVSPIYNGIQSSSPLKIDVKRTFNLPRDKLVICAVGRLVEAKGFDVLLNAIDGLPISLVIAGDGPERDKLQANIDKLKSPTSCMLIGNYTDVSSLMYSCDATIISSRREGFSYVFNEAALVGSNLLSTDVPVANEVLPPWLIVPINNAELLRTRLMHLLANRNEWSHLMRAVHQQVKKEMTLKAMTESTLAVYQDVLRQTHG